MFDLECNRLACECDDFDDHLGHVLEPAELVLEARRDYLQQRLQQTKAVVDKPPRRMVLYIDSIAEEISKVLCAVFGCGFYIFINMSCKMVSRSCGACGQPE